MLQSPKTGQTETQVVQSAVSYYNAEHDPGQYLPVVFQNKAYSLVRELDLRAVWTHMPRIVTSALAESFQSRQEGRELDLECVREDDPRIYQTAWHEQGRESVTPPPGE